MIYVNGNAVNTPGLLLTTLFGLRRAAAAFGVNASPEMVAFRAGITSLIAKMSHPNTREQTFQEYLASQEDWHLPM